MISKFLKGLGGDKPPTERSKSPTGKKGDRSEAIAVEHLRKLGYEIVARNYSCKTGEIDIVGKHNGELAFIEVRSKHSRNTYDPVYSVNRRKQVKIVRTAQYYIKTKRLDSMPFRFDVVTVVMTDPPTVDVIPNAFDADPGELYR